MRKAILNTLYYPERVGGAEVSVQAIAEGLSKGGDSVLVVALHGRDSIVRSTLNGVEVIHIPIPNLYWPFPDTSHQTLTRKILWHAIDSYNPIAHAELQRILSDFEPDLIQTHNLAGFPALIWRHLAKKRIPIVHTLHDYSLICLRTTMMRAGENCRVPCNLCSAAALPRQLASSRVNAVVGVSQFVLDTHLRAGFFPNAQFKTVIFNGYDPAPASSTGDINSSKDGRLRLGFLGAVAPHKGIEVLLEAVSRLPRESLVLKIGGNGAAGYISELRSLYTGANIEFCGRVETGDFFSGIDLLAVPSVWNEPFGRVVIEAFTHGIPVVAARTGGLPEIVVDNVNGCIVPANDTNALADVLRNKLQDRAALSRLRDGALNSSKGFASSIAATRYRELHDRLLFLNTATRA